MTTTNFRPSKIIVDLDAITHNVGEIKKHAHGSKLAIAVKSNAYGHGIVKVSKHLESIGVDMLLVSSADEALELRENNIQIPILILSEITNDAIAMCCKNNISFTAYTEEFINKLAKTATKENPASVHLKINTGMNRVGCEPHDVLKLASFVNQESSLNLDGVFTHFATAEDLDSFGFDKQNNLFESIINDLKEIGIDPPLIHSCNSAATIKYPQAQHSMVRVGLAAYGLYPKEGMEKILNLKPALKLISEIGFIKTVAPHEKISYGWHYEFDEFTHVGTIPIGYGDGVPRNLGINGGTVSIKGKRCKIVGVVTMDQLMVDIEGIDADVGEEVVLIGKDISVDEWAELANTISWEILCSFSARLPRIYD